MTVLDEIEARADAATEGPWEMYDGNEGTEYAPLWCVANDAFHNPPEDEAAEWIGVEIYVGDKPDAEFIAHAREDVPKLVAALRAVEAVHFDAGGSQGYFDDGYSWRGHCCNECGSLGEYGIEYPCPTITAINGVLDG